MFSTRTAGALTLALALAACSDAPTSTSAAPIAPSAPAAARAATPAPSTSVTGTVTNAAGMKGTFVGTATLQSVSTQGTQLLGTFLVNGTATVGGVATAITQAVTVPMTNAATCPILDLDVGAIHLNLLGLVIDLAPIHLDIVAQSGPGQLLGNLLCAVVNLLNGPTGGALGAALTNLLNTINGLLAGL